MTIKAGDIRFVASRVMSDAPEAAGPPTAKLIPDGASNAIFPDVREVDRAGGKVEIRQVHLAVRSTDTDTLGGAHVIVSEIPDDPDVSLTLTPGGTFATRAELADRIASYFIPFSQWPAYLLENHVAGQRSISLLQRPGTALPPINRTLVLVYQEGLPTERKQFVRVIRVESVLRTFTEQVGGSVIDFQAEVVSCELADKLLTDFPGSPASRTFARQDTKTLVRDTTAADAGSYKGASRLAQPTLASDNFVIVDSIYTQLVPSSRTDSISLDQRPAGKRVVTLATAPRRVDVGITPHSMRVKIGQENRGFSFVQILTPPPAPGTVVADFCVLGVWYTVSDDGAGQLTGAGAGTVNYATGSIAVTLPSLPDVGSSVIFQWGEKTAFTDRAGQAGFRAPEFALKLDYGNVKPGAPFTVTWPSGGVLRTATGAAGVLSGDALGEIAYATGTLRLRPKFMIDAGGEFVITYDYSTVITKEFPGVAVDAGGFASLVLDAVPTPGTVAIRWTTVRTVTASSGGASSGTAAGKSNTSTINYTNVVSGIAEPTKPLAMPPDPDAPPPEPGAPPPAPPPEPERPPAKQSRVPITPDGNQVAYGMLPGGTTATGGIPVFVAVFPTQADGLYGYDVPDAADAVWTDLEVAVGQKEINGTTYRRWGTQPTTNNSN